MRWSAYAKQQRRGARTTPTSSKAAGLRPRRTASPEKAIPPWHFVGLWDTVKSAGTMTRQLTWPFTRQLPHAPRHFAMRFAIDREPAGPFAPYLVHQPNPQHLFSDENQGPQGGCGSRACTPIVGGMFATRYPVCPTLL